MINSAPKSEVRGGLARQRTQDLGARLRMSKEWGAAGTPWIANEEEDRGSAAARSDP